MKATALGITLLMRQLDPSRSWFERGMSGHRVLKATLPLVATSVERSRYACFLYFDYPVAPTELVTC
ncbi:hypothetical protein Taro_024882 [Colocasia esculenta]|uniref:Uncharacterized protein n=1 Tax=Colocasia esculenta TaxID=4460 RepID=A0A843VEX6_COLES|nr:hypothetical protein [Colocasia esculenta]